MKYILAGYNKEKDQLNTKYYNSIKEVIEVINWWRAQSNLDLFEYTDMEFKNLESQIQGCKIKLGYGYPIDTDPKIKWSICAI